MTCPLERERNDPLSTCPTQADFMLLQNFSYHQFLPMPRSMMDLLGTYPYHTLAALLFGCMTLFRQLKRDKNRNPNGLPLPPGPRGYPLIGSLFDFPFNRSWLVYDEWTKGYGDMIYFSVLGQGFLILGSPQRISDVFEKRSLNYSDRMLPPMLKLMGFDFLMALLPYGVRWRKLRRMIYEHFHVNALYKHLPTQRREVHTFLHRLLVTPDNFFLHIRHLFAAIIMQVTYGIHVQESDDPYVSVAEEAFDGFAKATIPGTFWVDLLPILKYIPSWFPGAGFQKKAAHWRKVNASAAANPFRYANEQLKNGKVSPSIVTTLIERLPHEDDPQRSMEEKLAQDAAATAYAGGADISTSAVQTLFLAMALHPEVQRKAQAEIDAVVGPNRLPYFEDRPSLPYINAVVKESMRWHLVAPVGFPHMATNDDEYDGYFIPKGTLVFGNAWSILHNPKYFTNPMEYQPERYLKDGKLDPTVMDPASVAFGFGRRACPGRYFSDNSLYLIVSCLLAVYEIRPPVDDQGGVIKLKPEFTSSMLSFPVPFHCIIKPRTPVAEALIRDSVHEEVSKDTWAATQLNRVYEHAVSD